MTNFVITISRQYGSGGRFIAKKLAEKLNIPYYDNEIITLSAKESGFDESIFENAEQNASHSLLYSLSMFGSGYGVHGLPISDKVYLVQSDIIKKCAKAGPCVIVGRCADYILRDIDVKTINVFLYSDIESRVKRVETYYNLDVKNIQAEIQKRDKKRAAYYNYYTTERWGDTDNYHIALNTDKLGIDGCVDVLEKFVESADKNL